MQFVAEAQAIAQYNTELANLKSRRVRFWNRTALCSMKNVLHQSGHSTVHPDQCYSYALRPTANEDRYPQTDRPADDAFDLKTRWRDCRTLGTVKTFRVTIWLHILPTYFFLLSSFASFPLHKPSRSTEWDPSGWLSTADNSRRKSTPRQTLIANPAAGSETTIGQ